MAHLGNDDLAPSGEDVGAHGRLAGPASPTEFDVTRSKLVRRRTAWALALGAVTATATLGALLRLTSFDGSVSGTSLTEGVQRDTPDCSPPRSSGDAASPPSLDAASTLVDRILVARHAGADLGRCLSTEALAAYDTPVPMFDRSLQSVRACLYFDECDAGRVTSVERSPDATRLITSAAAMTVVSVIVEVDTVGIFTEQFAVADAGDGEVVVQAIYIDGGSLVTAVQAARAVGDFLQAMTDSEWSRAERMMSSAGRDVTGVEAGSTPSEDVAVLAELEPQLAASGDLAGMLRAYCQVHGGVCRTVHRVVLNEPETVTSRLVTVSLDAGAGPAADFRVTWFEGEMTVSGLPPRADPA